MRIFFSPDGSDPMLLDTKAGLHALHAELEAFLASTASSAEFPRPKPRLNGFVTDF
jgi:hypothetical protein